MIKARRGVLIKHSSHTFTPLIYLGELGDFSDCHWLVTICPVALQRRGNQSGKRGMLFTLTLTSKPMKSSIRAWRVYQPTERSPRKSGQLEQSKDLPGWGCGESRDSSPNYVMLFKISGPRSTAQLYYYLLQGAHIYSIQDLSQFLCTLQCPVEDIEGSDSDVAVTLNKLSGAASSLAATARLTMVISPASAVARALGSTIRQPGA